MTRAVLLDLDGTLIDSNDAHTAAWVAALQEQNISVEFAKVRQLIGMGGDQLLPALIGVEESSELGRKVSERRGEIFRQEYLRNLKPFPGARDLVEKMLEHHLEVVVATSASKNDLQGLLEQIGIADLIEKSTSKDDTENSKPSPDIIEAALGLTPWNPQETVMLGDTPYDIKAAERAGVPTIAFTCGGWNPEALKEAIQIFEGPWQLLQEFENSALVGNITKQIHSENDLYSGSVPPY